MNTPSHSPPYPLGYRRVVVTGIGMITPLGMNVETSWRNLLDGHSGVRPIDRFDAAHLPCRIAGLLPQGNRASGGFDPSDWADSKELKKMDDFIVYALAAAHEAIHDAGWLPQDIEQRDRTGVMVGAGIGGLPGIEATARVLERTSARRISPFFIPSTLINLAGGHIAIQYGFRGPAHAAVTACASGAHAIGDAARMIALDDADVMIAGGTEATVCELGIGGFCAARALSTAFNDTAERASRPWDVDRDGFVMGEGSGILVLEEYEHARRRGAHIHAEIVGYGMSGDAYHIVSPPEDGNGAARAMQAALRRAGVGPERIDYLNAHATSTMAGDLAEIAAIKSVFGAHATAGAMSISSTKSSMGHLLGAAGSVEAILSILALRDQIAPPTRNLETASDACAGFDLTAKVPRHRRIDYTLSNSFGFGGTNASLVFRRLPEQDIATTA